MDADEEFGIGTSGCRETGSGCRWCRWGPLGSVPWAARVILLGICVLIGSPPGIAAGEGGPPAPTPVSLVSTQVVVVTNLVVMTNVVVTTNAVAMTNLVGQSSSQDQEKNVFGLLWWDEGLNYRLTQWIKLGATNELGHFLVNERVSMTGRMGVKAAFDGAAFVPARGQQDVATDGEIRTLRFYTSGDFTWRRPMYFKVELGIVNREFYLHEAFVRFKEVPWVKNVTVGYLVTPFSLDNISSFGNTTFMEPAAVVQAFAPANRMALQIDGNWREQRMGYQLGLFALGQSTSLNFGDASDGLARAMGRLTGLPILNEDPEEYRLLHLGAAVSHVFSDTSKIQYRSRPESHLAPFLVDTGEIEGRNALQLGGEVAYLRGPLTLQGELIASGVDVQETGDQLFWGAYGYVGWFITGEHRAYNKSLGAFSGFAPTNPVSIRDRTWGALELGLRYSYLDLTDGPIDGGRMSILLPGVNWYLSRHLRLQFNYGWAEIQGGASPGDLHIFQGRAQLLF